MVLEEKNEMDGKKGWRWILPEGSGKGVSDFSFFSAIFFLDRESNKNEDRDVERFVELVRNNLHDVSSFHFSFFLDRNDLIKKN